MDGSRVSAEMVGARRGDQDGKDQDDKDQDGQDGVLTGPLSALEQARAGPEDRGMFAGSVVGLVESMLDAGIDGRSRFQSALAVADEHRARGIDGEAAVDAVVARHLRMAAAGGFVTGVGGFVTLPVALPANVVEFYLLATRMVAATASLRGYDIARPEVRSAILLTLVGADAEDLVGRAGVRHAGGLSNLVAERLPGPAMMVVNKALGFKLIATWGRHALPRFGKAVPVVGGAVGAGLDAYLLKRIADHAREEFPRHVPGSW